MQMHSKWPGMAIHDYLVDAFQRSIMFLDVLRRRGDEQEVITDEPNATVFTFKYDVILSGRQLARPINYYLGRIIPPAECLLKPDKAPVVVVDPRAGQGPGISGFKPKSEIGMAFTEGHPVYFIGFSSNPVDGQTFLDVLDGQVEFIKHVVSLHPNSPRPIAIGNCQAGYQTLMAAMLQPDLFGTIIMAGSPMSYWQGVHGKNPLRYSGGLEGGSWLAALTSDMGNGKFDGANLIANFDNLNPANFLWGKQYHVYANIDHEPARYLDFEKWWGDFITLNGNEIQYLADQLFIGNKLTANKLISNDGHIFDLRNVTAPIICFTSMGDNISPPQQTLGWILDLYRSVEEIRERRRTIVYCVDSSAGHLAIFVSAKVAVREDAAFVRTMDLLNCLPPGLYEMTVTPKDPEKPIEDLTRADFIASFERRTLDDIRAFGRNSVADDKAFSTVRRLSEINLSIYRAFMQPLVRMMASEPFAETLRRLHPIRLRYSLFASNNPLMQPVQALAEKIRQARKPIAEDNPCWVMQNSISQQIENALNSYTKMRDTMMETMFFTIYSSPFIQGILGTYADSDYSNRPPALSPTEEATFESARSLAMEKMDKGGIDEAIIRALIFVLSGERQFDERMATALSNLIKQRFHLTIDDLKRIVREQTLMLHVNQDESIKKLSKLVKMEDDQKELITLVTKIISATGNLDVEAKRRLQQISHIFESEQ